MKEYGDFNRLKGGLLAVAGFVLIFALGSCNLNERPRGVLSHEEMVKVLSDLYVTEEKINKLGVSRDSATKVFEYLNGKIFENLGTTDSTFKQSLSYYMERPDEIEKIYSALIDSLNLREQRLSLPHEE